MANERWNANKNIRFIKEYQRNECLWDPKHPQYKNKGARLAAYEDLMELMDLDTVKDVVSKIRSLRNTYNNEALKAKKSYGPGKNPDQMYVSKIPWLHHFDFIRNIDSNAKVKADNFIPNISQESSSESELPDPPINQKKYKRKLKDPLLNTVNVTETAFLDPLVTASNNDEFDLFGQTIAAHLRKLPLEVALETEEMLLSTIIKQRIRAVQWKQLIR